jgi:hypothetical protein
MPQCPNHSQGSGVRPAFTLANLSCLLDRYRTRGRSSDAISHLVGECEWSEENEEVQVVSADVDAAHASFICCLPIHIWIRLGRIELRREEGKN